MSKYFFILLLSVFSIHIGARGFAQYSEASDTFEVLDHLSGWHKSMRDEYRKMWEKKFPLSLIEKTKLDKYSEIRKKYYKQTGAQESSDLDSKNIFGKMDVGYDSLSHAFYSSNKINEAITKLMKGGMSRSEAVFLKSFYEYFEKKVQTFIRLSAGFNIKILDFNKRWRSSKSEKIMKMVSGFVLGKLALKLDLKLRPVFWPIGMPSEIDSRGGYVILRINPSTQVKNWPLEIIRKEVVRTILLAQSQNQKDNLSKVFNAKCNGRAIELRQALSIIFSNMLLAAHKNKNNFNMYARWHNRNFTDLLVKLLYPFVSKNIASDGLFAERFINEASNLCKGLNDLAIVP